jgi:hypothetical protein
MTVCYCDDCPILAQIDHEACCEQNIEMLLISAGGSVRVRILISGRQSWIPSSMFYCRRQLIEAKSRWRGSDYDDCVFSYSFHLICEHIQVRPSSMIVYVVGVDLEKP